MLGCVSQLLSITKKFYLFGGETVDLLASISNSLDIVLAYNPSNDSYISNTPMLSTLGSYRIDVVVYENSIYVIDGFNTKMWRYQPLYDN